MRKLETIKRDAVSSLSPWFPSSTSEISSLFDPAYLPKRESFLVHSRSKYTKFRDLSWVNIPQIPLFWPIFTPLVFLEEEALTFKTFMEYVSSAIGRCKLTQQSQAPERFHASVLFCALLRFCSVLISIALCLWLIFSSLISLISSCSSASEEVIKEGWWAAGYCKTGQERDLPPLIEK